MNRPPVQGFPYDVDHPKPPEYGARPAGPRVLCGFPTGTGTCGNTAPCPIHRDLLADLLVSTGAVDPAPGLEAAIAAEPHPEFAELQKRVGDVAALKPIPKYDPDSPVDLHDQLHADDQPWSVKSRLAASLGRRALATRLADALPPLLGAELADRLDTLVRQALTEQEAAITQQLSDGYYAARARLDADAAQKLKEVHDERYRGHSRLD